MKILKLHEHRTNPGGIVSLQNDFQKYYSTSNHQYLYFRTGKVNNHPILSISIIRFLDLALSYLYFPLFLIFHHPDVIEINSSLVKKSFYRDLVYLKLAKIFSKKSKLVLFNHGWNDEFKLKLSTEKKQTFINFYGGFNQIILLAQYFKEELETAGVDTSNVHIITTGINYQDYESLGVKKNFSNRLLFLSRVEPEKGIFQFLGAIPSLLAINKDFIFDIAGDGEAMDQVRNHDVIKKHNENIVFHGYALGESKIELFKNAAMYIFPSYHGEGCPVSVLEAMAAGLPVIYTNVGALIELLKDDLNGILIPPKDTNALVNAIKKIYENPALRISMGELNKKTAAQNFDLKMIFDRLESIYEKKVCD